MHKNLTNIQLIVTELQVTKALFLNNKTKKSKVIYYWNQINIDSRLKDKSNKVTYIVQKGDYLIKIGKKFNVDWKQIAKDNNIKTPYIIKVGQKLVINKTN